MTAFNTRKRYKYVHDSALPWLYGICVNELRNYKRNTFRKNRATFKILSRDSSFESTSVRHSEISGIIDDQSRTKIWEKFYVLRIREQEVLSLSIFEELTHNEIAQVLNISSGTVKSRIHRATKKLQQKFESLNLSNISKMIPKEILQEQSKK